MKTLLTLGLIIGLTACHNPTAPEAKPVEKAVKCNRCIITTYVPDTTTKK